MNLGRLGSCLVLFAAIVCLLPSREAGCDDIQITAGIRTGIMYGMAKEFVYIGSDSFAISELDWPSEPIVFEESTLEVRVPGGLHGLVMAQVGLPGDSGQMTDSDWLNYPNYSNPTAKTHYSQSNSYTEKSISIEARLGLELKPSEAFVIEPFAMFGYMSWEWSARDGYYQYPSQSSAPYTPWSPSVTQTPMYGTVGIYRQTYLIPGAGLRMDVHLDRRWDISASFAFSPFVYCSVLDTHVLRDIDISGALFGGTMLEPSLEVRFALAEKVSASLGARYRHIAGLRGDEVVVGGTAQTTYTPGTQYVNQDGYGASYDMLSVWLNFTLSL